jgi:hypothetical protein
MSSEVHAIVGGAITLPDGRSTMVLAVLPEVPEQGIPVRVWLAGDPPNVRREWPEILETCTVQGQ